MEEIAIFALHAAEIFDSEIWNTKKQLELLPEEFVFHISAVFFSTQVCSSITYFETIATFCHNLSEILIKRRKLSSANMELWSSSQKRSLKFLISLLSQISARIVFNELTNLSHGIIQIYHNFMQKLCGKAIVGRPLWKVCIWCWAIKYSRMN